MCAAFFVCPRSGAAITSTAGAVPVKQILISRKPIPDTRAICSKPDARQGKSSKSYNPTPVDSVLFIGSDLASLAHVCRQNRPQISYYFYFRSLLLLLLLILLVHHLQHILMY